MKKLLTLMVMGFLMLGIAPIVLAEGASVGGGVTIDPILNPNTAPKIWSDDTERSWYPNDQTFYTASYYDDNLGTSVPEENDYCDDFYNVGMRGDYLFTGETVTYYVLVEDEDGEDDITSVILQDFDTQVGTCVEIDPTDDLGCSGPNWAWNEALDQFETDLVFDDATMNLYKCMYIVPSSLEDVEVELNVKATDTADHSVETAWSEFLKVNPPLSVTLTGGIDFGSAEAGTTVTSNTIQLNNVGSDGVVMDMYVASDDYFTDPLGIGNCGIWGNGIPYTEFSYYASKGSVDSGSNDNSWSGLGEDFGELCEAETDEYTEMPSHSGEIFDMCRIINHQIDGSALTQGQSMNLRFQLDIPLECSGSFSDGQFYFVGRVI